MFGAWVETACPSWLPLIQQHTTIVIIVTLQSVDTETEDHRVQQLGSCTRKRADYSKTHASSFFARRATARLPQPLPHTAPPNGETSTRAVPGFRMRLSDVRFSAQCLRVEHPRWDDVNSAAAMFSTFNGQSLQDEALDQRGLGRGLGSAARPVPAVVAKSVNFAK